MLFSTLLFVHVALHVALSVNMYMYIHVYMCEQTKRISMCECVYIQSSVVHACTHVHVHLS